ncbi:MAG: DUF971 domain-containing protein [Gammaproteobacteria bacterium]|nr:DUF971 domain-containing protein [Gammaproteobacteria bacterium]
MMDPIPRYKICSAEVLKNRLEIRWGDNHISAFHPIWMRHQCYCTDCGTPLSGIRGIRLHQIPEDIAIVSAELFDNTVRIRWSGGDHTSLYSGEWLRNHCYSSEERRRRRHQPILWDASLANDIPIGSLTQAEKDPSSRLRILEAICDYGFCKITDAPTDIAEKQRLIALVGVQRQTHFGTYTLTRKKRMTNVGDTTSQLDPHVDEPYRLSPIGITVFQVLHPSTNGGESTLVDGFEAVRRLKQRWPEDFHLLCRLPIVNQRFDPGDNSHGNERWYKSRLPVIKLDDNGKVCGIRTNERQMSPLDIAEDMVEPSYRALRRLYSLLYDKELRLVFALKAGEGLLFDNQRLLHGLNEFMPEEPQRSVLTSSVDLDEFHSSLRLLQRDLKSDRMHMLLRQGMAG